MHADQRVDYLLDNLLSPKQAQQLLHMICHPRQPSTTTSLSAGENAIELIKVAETEAADLKQQIFKTLSNLDEWKLDER